MGFAPLTSALAHDVAELKNDVAGLKNDVGHLKDSDLEMKVHRRIRPLLSQHLGLRRARIVQSAVHQPPDDFEAKVQKAADDNRITGEQEHRLVATDLILQARSSRDANTVWIAVEVANRIAGADISGRADGKSAFHHRPISASGFVHPALDGEIRDAGKLVDVAGIQQIPDLRHGRKTSSDRTGGSGISGNSSAIGSSCGRISASAPVVLSVEDDLIGGKLQVPRDP